MYSCKICNYETTARTALYNHNKSQKHLAKLQNIKLNEEKDILEKQTKEIEELKKKISEMEKEKELLIKDKEIEKLEMKAQIYKELSEKSKNINQGIIINNNTNNLNYVNKHFKNAPPLRKITNYKLNGIDLEDETQIDKLSDNIIYSYNNKCLHKLIGDHIIKIYKKEDLQLQSFHTSDVSRRKYVVKLDDEYAYLYDESSDEIDDYNPLEENTDSDNDNNSEDEYKKLEKVYKQEQRNKLILKNKSKWVQDNEGVKVLYLLADPVIKKIVRLLKKKCRDYNEEMEHNSKKIPTIEETEKFKTLANILKEMDKNKLRKNINNYIAPYFGLDKK